MQSFIAKTTCIWCCLFTQSLFATTLDLRLGLVRAGGQHYFVDLLKQSLEASGYKTNITVKGELPQKRMIKMMNAGELSLTWLLQSKERDNKYVPVEVPITNGLIGNRILLIPKDKQAIYDSVKTVDDFRNLNKVGVFGKNWFDIAIWKRNNLKFIEKDGRWQEKVYRQIANGDRGVDYFSRGFFEIVEEHNKHPYLAIEENLIFIYDRDFRYYLSEAQKHLKSVITNSLKAAQKSGLMDRLIRQHWGESFEKLKPDTRRKIHLDAPQ